MKRVISEIVFGIVHGQPYEKFQKLPHIPYEFSLLVIGLVN
jgi:hypothetical protein